MWEGLGWVCFLSVITAENGKEVLFQVLNFLNARGKFLYSHHLWIEIHFTHNQKQLAKPCDEFCIVSSLYRYLQIEEWA